MTATQRATQVFCGPGRVLSNAAIHHEGGVITAVTHDKATAHDRRTFVIPALVNAHDHARPTMSSFGAAGMPLETWIARSVYGTPPDPYLAAAVSLARSARSGCGAMMIHYTRASGTMPIVDEAKAIAMAARDVGIRLAFALAVRDQNPMVYGDSTEPLAALPEDARRVVEGLYIRPAMSPRHYVDLIEEIALAVASPTVDVQFGPAGVQWCSPALLETIAEHSAHTGRRVHMHLLETVYQRAWADRVFPNGIVRYLKDIGLLSDRLTLAHCIYATPAELDLIAQSGAIIVTNFSSNLHLHSGLGPVADAHRRGCPIAVGVDGIALDEDDDAIREMRLVQMMHGGRGFERTWSRADFLGLAVRNGRRSTGAPGTGELVPGHPADFVVLDLDGLDRDAIMPVDPLDMLFARGNAAFVRDVVVAGRPIVRDGKLTGVDLAAMEIELRALFRKSVSHFAALERNWKPFEAALTGWFRAHCGCG
jgi:cytosine/adenosine deaminase-related metal-dependent hydrolase